ncbi:multiple monosaccharide ABC transporter permease [Sediminivirga luteola]|uniref:Xylose transport system permease protein XylH n=1 Tax=Sediminivirga luteola TaxID=1774748 RepID=A0A8J2U0Y1_9MICO|nr:multiple monosaccharide ABC transporter permease [Sediminivirga luteola]MCI2264890.1 sugar ABC transporter permease [Sediminivirga luteola]GGA26496.1 ABC transporter permease [Sediminivirga luteola]
MTGDTAARPQKRGFALSDVWLIFGRRGSLKQLGILGALVVIIAIFQIWTGGTTLAPGNVINIVQAYSFILLLSVGMVMVIIAGHIDLSVGSVAAFVAIVVATAMRDWELPWWGGVLLGIALGAAIGAFQGFWVAYIGVPAFIVTLAGMLIWRGAQQYVGQAQTVAVPAEFRQALYGFMPEVGPPTPYNNLTLLLGALVVAAIVFFQWRSRAKRKKLNAILEPLWVTLTRTGILCAVVIYATLLFGSGRVGTSFPISGIILAVLIIFYAFLTSRTTLGRHIYAVGGNRRAAELSGVHARRTDFFVMMNMSTLAGVAGMLWAARAGAAGPGDGTGWELDAIAGVFIGGAAVAGGIGTVFGSVIGGLVMAVLNNGLQLVGITTDRMQIIKGLVLLVAVGIDVLNKQQGRFSFIGIMLGRLRATRAQQEVEEISPGSQRPDPPGKSGPG